MRATRLVSLVVPLLVVPGLAAAQSRSFSYERGIDRPGHAYRVLETHNAADCSLACQAANSCRAWTYVKPGAPRRAGTASRCWLKHVVPRAIRNDCCTSGVRKRSASHIDHSAARGPIVRPPVASWDGRCASTPNCLAMTRSIPAQFVERWPLVAALGGPWARAEMF